MKMLKKFYIIILAISIAVFTSCELSGGESLNGASTNSISDDLSRGELPQAISGILSDMRERLNTQIDVQSIFGREYYYFTSSDPRFEGDVVIGNLDNNTFYTTAPWGSRYAAIKDINLTLTGLENTTSDFSNEEILATRGVLNTLKAHELLMVANNQYTNGIRLDVSDPDNLGPFVTYQEALTAIDELLREAATDLSNGGSSYPFELSTGYPATLMSFLEFNKGLNARVEAYRGNYPNVISLLNDSFMNMNESLDKGVYHVFSLSGADIPNPLYLALNQVSNVRVAHSSFVDDALPMDSRLNKVVLRDNPAEASGLVGEYDVFIYESNVDRIPIMRNEELILLYAEANMSINPAEAEMAINTIRNAANLDDYSGALTPEALEDEILFQRRYSLFGEGHRWVDMRRFNRLSELPNDRAGDTVPEAVPIPANENE
ncbi:RagB/SusD family nutrient uptake outer membrane protein [Winogradskyella bathintestinalis]|uniref:RagB/SusD family nutrient uptake outer membrane protein n=1 Tax=Winogradskyella bathintestinalis TaxID=3035208 RepID=A0ABT7ZSF7_9FLAO|nr:RagB/SusD family nutrient uptake outer membrane protein [Winogradskyella bathintestinalis]MDN3491942.1 RagB/SusD family nutrient uptake outer membrane protein [Winogradskyella bathintestinalis]